MVWLAVMLVQIRNLYGFVVLVGCGAAVALASWYLPAPWLSTIAYLITWVLLIASPRPVLELIRPAATEPGATLRCRSVSQIDPDPRRRLDRDLSGR